MNGHPSFLQLDRLALGSADPQVAAHVESCETCRAQLSRVQQAPPVPAWVGDLRSAKSSRRTWWAGSVGALAAIGLVLMIASPRRGPDGDPGAKGAPSVAVYVKRGDVVSLWDGRAPFAPGDALRLKISPQGFGRVAVASLQGDTITELYAAPVTAHGASVLPPSWTCPKTDCGGRPPGCHARAKSGPRGSRSRSREVTDDRSFVAPHRSDRVGHRRRRASPGRGRRGPTAALWAAPTCATRIEMRRASLMRWCR